MANNVREKLKADIGVALTGIAGPDGGTKEKPVGTVYFAYTESDHTYCINLQLSGSRSEIRWSSAIQALKYIKQRIEGLGDV